MREQVYNLFEELKKYRDSDKRHQDENYFTEILRWYLNNVDYFRKAFLDIMGLPKMLDVRFKSQEPLYKKDGFMDLYAETETDIIIIENKIHHHVYESQLDKYIKDVQGRTESKNPKIHLFLITKYRIEEKIIKFLETHTEDGKRIHKTWQDLYDELLRNLSDTQQSDTFWKLLNAYFLSSGLLRRELFTSLMIDTDNRSFLVGQCKSLMEDLDHNSGIKEMFSNYRSIYKISDDNSKHVIENRWGRIGLNLRYAQPNSSKSWWPNIFIGVVLDGTDHKLYPFDTPKVVVIVEWNKKKNSKARNLILENWKQSLNEFKNQNQENNTKIHLNYELENKWRFIVIEKDLKHFTNKQNREDQDKEFIEFYLKWLKMLNEKLGIHEIFAD